MKSKPIKAESGSGQDGGNVTILLAAGYYDAPTVRHSPLMIALRDASGEDVVTVAPVGAVRIRGVIGGVSIRVYDNLARFIGWGHPPCVGGMMTVQPGRAGVNSRDDSPAGKNGEVRIYMEESVPTPDGLSPEMEDVPVTRTIPILLIHGDGTTTPRDPSDVFANLVRLSDEMDRRWPPSKEKP